MPTYGTYVRARDQLLEEYDSLDAGAPVRLGKRTSNLFRMRDAVASPGLDVSAFDGVLDVDQAGGTADVLGMTTYEHLVAATLPHGLMPLVVPQLKTITLGGAVTGLGIESSSFVNGCPHESVLDMDVLTGDGRVLTVTPDGDHADLFHGFPNSYGTLGYALRLRIELQPVLPYVELEHVRFHDRAEYFATVAEIAAHRRHAGRLVDFVDGVVFDTDELYLTLGRFVATAPYVSDYTGNEIYYRSIQHRRRDFLTVHDYIWRWDTDWFWCSRALGVQHRLVRPLVPRRLKRSDVYWRAVGFERRHGWKARYDRSRGRPDREAVIQDVEVPVDRAAEFLEVFEREIGISPVWMCPLRQREGSRRWDLYALDPSTTYVNFGFWSTVPLDPGEADGTHNRLIERLVSDLGGRKSLYSSAYYEEDEFWQTYGGDSYRVLKKEYDPDDRLLDLFSKCVRAR
ncbi:MAG TPA: FAD-binding oxidoreductase [Actinomycetes bacterium]|nr:FAD-binding oxidoreductase [Actinomycetes bacterium]